MKIDYDPAKSLRNIEERGLSFDLVNGFDWGSALFAEDKRQAYPERRFEAVGWIEERLHVIVFAYIPGGVRVISFRKANKREVNRYGK